LPDIWLIAATVATMPSTVEVYEGESEASPSALRVVTWIPCSEGGDHADGARFDGQRCVGPPAINDSLVSR
jgi:hypothetical protein